MEYKYSAVGYDNYQKALDAVFNDWREIFYVYFCDDWMGNSVEIIMWAWRRNPKVLEILEMPPRVKKVVGWCIETEQIFDKSSKASYAFLFGLASAPEI